MRVQFLPALLCLGVLAACEPTLASRGYVFDPEKLTEIRVGESSREDVATRLGTPTSVSTFDDKVWYYVGRQTEQYSFFDPEVMNQEGVEIRFDDQGTVTALNKLDAANIQDVATVNRRTPTYGHDNTLIRQLIGNLSRPRPNSNNDRRQGP